MSDRADVVGAAADKPRQVKADLGIERLMTVEEVAEYLGVPVNTLYQWRHKGTGPTAFRVGRFLRYDAADVRAWLHEKTGTSHGVGRAP